jgi:hypothetical protein
MRHTTRTGSFQTLTVEHGYSPPVEFVASTCFIDDGRMLGYAHVFSCS